MKIKAIITIFMISLLYSCGSKKVAVTQDGMVQEINSYAMAIDTNGLINKETIEGALTDTDGFNDIGTFKYTVYFNEGTKELLKVENVEKIDKTITETYYFKNQNLVRLISISDDMIKKIYLMKDRVIYEENTTSKDQQLLIEKAKRFQKSFLKSH